MLQIEGAISVLVHRNRMLTASLRYLCSGVFGTPCIYEDQPIPIKLIDHVDVGSKNLGSLGSRSPKIRISFYFICGTLHNCRGMFSSGGVC